jgi:ArsR family transcriptional regulator
MKDFGDIFKALSDSTRLRIIHLLLSNHAASLCVCEIVDALEEPQYNVSRHLRILRRVGLLNETKDGRWVHYSIQSLGNPFFSHLYQAISSITHETLQADKQRLQERLTLREGGKCLLGIQKKHLLSGKDK